MGLKEESLTLDTALSPHMDPEGLDFFIRAISRSKCYLEYGAGKSTIYAAKVAHIPKLVSVDSDPIWIENLSKVLDPSRVADQELHLIYADIGKTEAWGNPVDSSGFKSYWRYPTVPWMFCRRNKWEPDLILIDGRFRVASFLYSLILCESPATVMFDDYAERPHYHVIEQFLPLSRLCGRMAIFELNPVEVNKDIIAVLMEYSNAFE